MEQIIIDCSTIDSREELHRTFAQALVFPAWYGNNLDALFDCLTSLTAETQIRLLDWDVAEEKLGTYGLSAKKALARAALRNPKLEVIF